jgi:hypothetical protein
MASACKEREWKKQLLHAAGYFDRIEIFSPNMIIQVLPTAVCTILTPSRTYWKGLETCISTWRASPHVVSAWSMYSHGPTPTYASQATAAPNMWAALQKIVSN